MNGKHHPYLRNSQHEAQRAARLLTAACGVPIPVVGVVVPVGADDLVIKSAPRHVRVVPRRQIRAWLRRRPKVLRVEVLDRVWEAARRPET